MFPLFVAGVMNRLLCQFLKQTLCRFRWSFSILQKGDTGFNVDSFRENGQRVLEALDRLGGSARDFIQESEEGEGFRPVEGELAVWFPY